MSNSAATKKLIADSLKKLCSKKNFDKISIADITQVCGLNRQTFYYHFADKYELLDWIYDSELYTDTIENTELDEWITHMRILMEKMKADKGFYLNTLRACPDNFTNRLYRLTCTLFSDAIREIDRGGTVNEVKCVCYSSFFAHGFCGIILDWVKNDMRDSPAEVSVNLKSLAEDLIRLGYMLYG